MVHCISIWGGWLKELKNYHTYNHVTIISCEYQGQMKQVLLIIVRYITFPSPV